MSRGTGWLLTLGVWFVLGGALVVGASGLQRRSACLSGQDRPGRTQADRLARTERARLGRAAWEPFARAATAAPTSASGGLQHEALLCVERDQKPLELTDRELTGLEALMDSAPCTACGGTGRDLHQVERRCSNCGGEGWTS